MERRYIALFWIVLLLPTLAAAGWMLQMLRHEQQRITLLTANAADAQAQIVADNVALMATDIKDGITEYLRNIPPEQLIKSLREWQAANPLIRNVFVWSETDGLTYPSLRNGMSEEERAFAQRYDALFERRTPWTYRGVQETAPPSTPAWSANTRFSQRNARFEVQQMLNAQPYANTAPSGEAGWIPWFWQTQLYLLGWVQSANGADRYGVELEMSYLQSKMMTAVPSEVPRGMAVAVHNANGVVVHQQGADILATKARPLATADLSPVLPHWQVKVYAVGSAATLTRQGYRLLSIILIAAFAAAIISSGALLLWQARRHSLVASQKTSFVSNVSHELKTPLTSIRMYAELLESGRITDTAKRKQYLTIIAAESQRLTRLVNNVLDFSRLEQGRRKFHLSALDLNAALTEAVDAMRGRLDAAGITVQMPAPPANGILVAADRDALSQILLNLIDNAIKYAASGKELAFEVRPLSDTCEVRVMDRGPGIPDPHRQRVFEKFYRIDTSLTATQPGSGLGLSIALRLVNGMDGTLHVEPRDGGGSAFVLTLKTEKT